MPLDHYDWATLETLYQEKKATASRVREALIAVEVEHRILPIKYGELWRQFCTAQGCPDPKDMNNKAADEYYD